MKLARMKRDKHGTKLYFLGDRGSSAFIYHHQFEQTLSLAPYDGGQVGIKEDVILHYHFKSGLEVTKVALCSHEELAAMLPELRAGQSFAYLDELWNRYSDEIYKVHLYKLATGQRGNRLGLEGQHLEDNPKPTLWEYLKTWVAT